MANPLYLSRLLNLLNPSNPLPNFFHGVDSDSNSLGKNSVQKLTKCQVLDGGRRVEPKVSEPYIRFCIFKHSTNIIRLADLLTDDAHSANPDSAYFFKCTKQLHNIDIYSIL